MTEIYKDRVRTSTPYEVCPKCWWPENECADRGCRTDEPPAAKPKVKEDLMAGVRVNDMADVFPMIGDEWSTFVADVAAQGVVNPIVWSADGSELIDGRNRLRAWLELGNTVESCPSRRLDEGEDAYAFIVSANVARRSMNKGQLVMAAARAYPLYEERARVRQSTLNNAADKFSRSEVGRARDEAGAAFRVSGAYVDLARKLLTAAGSDVSGRVGAIIAKVEKGELTMNAAKVAFEALDFTPSKLDAPAPTGKFDALAKAIKDLDTVDMVAAIKLMAEAAGVRVEIFEK